MHPTEELSSSSLHLINRLLQRGTWPLDDALLQGAIDEVLAPRPKPAPRYQRSRLFFGAPSPRPINRRVQRGHLTRLASSRVTLSFLHKGPRAPVGMSATAPGRMGR